MQGISSVSSLEINQQKSKENSGRYTHNPEPGTFFKLISPYNVIII